jgi:hypothetical protein
MNLVNITKHIVYLTETEFWDEVSTSGADEVFVAEK